MVADILRSFKLNMDNGHKLLADLTNEQFTKQPIAGMNHAAWIAGHLSYSFEQMAGELDVAPWLPTNWAKLFGTGSDSAMHRGEYPNRIQLLSTLSDSQKRLTDALSAMSDADLVKPLPDVRLRHIFPSLGSAVLHIPTVHAAVHIGQLSAWRRAIGLPR